MYEPEWVRLGDQAGSTEAQRMAFWKSRAPLGDAEFYLSVVDFPADLRTEMETARDYLAGRFDRGCKLNGAERKQVRDILAVHRARLRGDRMKEKPKPEAAAQATEPTKKPRKVSRKATPPAEPAAQPEASQPAAPTEPAGDPEKPPAHLTPAQKAWWTRKHRKA